MRPRRGVHDHVSPRFCLWTSQVETLRLHPSKSSIRFQDAHPPLLPLPTQDQTTETARKKKRTVKTNNRSIVGVSLEVIQKKRHEKSDVRAAARDAALREIKERQRKAKDGKKGGKK
jgi:hypothetical protein